MALFGSGFDSTQPTDVSDISAGAGWIRDIKTKLVSFLGVMFDLDTGSIKPAVITSAMLTNSGVTAGSIGGLTYDAKGRITGGAPATTLAGFGITDGISDSEGRIYQRTVTLTSAAAATPVEILPTSLVPVGKKAYVLDVKGYVNGAVAWGTTTNVKIQDNAGLIDFVTIATTSMTATAKLLLSTAGVTSELALIRNDGGTTNSGLRIRGDVNGTGSNFVCTCLILVK